MAWIKTIEFDQATGRLRTLFDQVAGKRRRVDNILAVHGLRPHTLSGHLALYKSVLHHTGNRLPQWFLEAVGVLVSILNECTYCEAHHAEGLRRVLGDDMRAARLLDALHERQFNAAFSPGEAAALAYTVRLTEAPSTVTAEHVQAMRSAGLSDGEILEVNQVAAYFAYANRTVNGLGVTVHGDELGLSPSATDDLTSWNHE